MEKYWPKINSFETVMSTAKQGAIWGLAFSAMLGLGLVLTAFDVLPNEDLKLATLIGIAIELCLVLFFTWRVSSGKGYVSAVLLLLLFIVEIVAKIFDGTASVFAIVFYGFAFLGLVNGVRATFAYKKYAASENIVEAF